MAEHEFAATHWDAAIAWYERFLSAIQNSAGTPLEEKWMAVIYKAKAERMAGRFVDAIRSADRAFLMCPQYADGPLELAYGYYVSNHFTKAIYWLEEAERRDAPVGILQTSPLDYECIRTKSSTTPTPAWGTSSGRSCASSRPSSTDRPTSCTPP